MGTLVGHILPGTFFFIFGLIGVINGYQRYFKTFIRGNTLFKSKTCTKYRFKDRKTNMVKTIPLESIIKVCASLFGITGEIITGISPEGNIGIHNSQHCMMYCLFGIQGMVEILCHRIERSEGLAKKVFPPNLDYIFGVIAFGGETLLFYWHLHGRNQLDIRVHTFLVYASMGCVIFSIVELWKRNSFLVFLIRNGFIIIQGTWFYHVGFILYPISENIYWDPNGHRDLMLIPIYFILHILSTSMLLGIIGFLFFLYMKKEIKNVRYFEVKSGIKHHLPLISSSSDSELEDLKL